MIRDALFWMIRTAKKQGQRPERWVVSPATRDLLVSLVRSGDGWVTLDPREPRTLSVFGLPLETKHRLGEVYYFDLILEGGGRLSGDVSA